MSTTTILEACVDFFPILHCPRKKVKAVTFYNVTL